MSETITAKTRAYRAVVVFRVGYDDRELDDDEMETSTADFFGSAAELDAAMAKLPGELVKVKSGEFENLFYGEIESVQLADQAAYEDWAKGLRFGLNVEDEVVAQVRELVKSAYAAGFVAGETRGQQC